MSRRPFCRCLETADNTHLLIREWRGALGFWRNPVAALSAMPPVKDAIWRVDPEGVTRLSQALRDPPDMGTLIASLGGPLFVIRGHSGTVHLGTVQQTTLVSLFRLITFAESTTLANLLTDWVTSKLSEAP